MREPLTPSSALPAVAPRRQLPPWVSGALLPFLFTRALLLYVGGFSYRMPFLRRWAVPGGGRDWLLSPRHLLDVWGRWDSGWYLDIARNGYHPAADLARAQSNLAFFPLYPMLVRAGHLLVPSAWQSQETLGAVAVAVSNLCAAGAVVVLFLHARERLGGDEGGRRAVLYLLAFPTAFFLSCAYTESAFLLLAVLTWHLAWKGRWALAGAAGLLLATSRANGILAALPLAVLALRQGPTPRAALRRLPWLALLPLGFALWAAWAGQLSDDPLAVFHVQRAWGRGFAWPWRTLAWPRSPDGMLDADRAVVILFAAGCAWMFRRRWLPEATWVAVMLAPILFSGQLTSASRLSLAAFPLFVFLADRAADGSAFARWYPVTGFALQAAFFVGWSRGVWIG